MILQAHIGAAFTVPLYGAPSGLVGTLRVVIQDDAGVVVDDSTAGVTETPVGGGLSDYHAQRTLTTSGNYRVSWTDGTTTSTPDDIVVAESLAVLPTAAQIRLWSDVEFGSLGYPEPEVGDPDRLDNLIPRAEAEFTARTGATIDIQTLDPESPDLRTRAVALLAQEAIQRLVEFAAARGQHEILETAADNDLIQSMSVSGYSETRRGLNQAHNRRHPWPLLAALLDLIVYFDNGGTMPREVPMVSHPEDAPNLPDWNVGARVMDTRRAVSGAQIPGAASSIFLPWWLENLPQPGGWQTI